MKNGTSEAKEGTRGGCKEGKAVPAPAAVVVPGELVGDVVPRAKMAEAPNERYPRDAELLSGGPIWDERRDDESHNGGVNEMYMDHIRVLQRADQTNEGLCSPAGARYRRERGGR